MSGSSSFLYNFDHHIDLLTFCFFSRLLCTLARTIARTLACTLARTLAPTHTCTHARTHAHTHAHTLTRTHARTLAHTLTRTHARSHANTLQQALKESGLHREGSAASDDRGSGSGRDRDYSVARGNDGNLIDTRTVTHAQFKEQKVRCIMRWGLV